MYKHNPCLALTRRKNIVFWCVFNVVNHNVCVFSSNDSIGGNKSPEARWALVLKATGWHIHAAERKPHHGLVQPPPLPSRPRLFHWPDNKTSNRWHVLMADAHIALNTSVASSCFFFFQLLSRESSPSIHKSAASLNWQMMVNCRTLCQMFEFYFLMFSLLVILPAQKTPVFILKFFLIHKSSHIGLFSDSRLVNGSKHSPAGEFHNISPGKIHEKLL